MHDTALMSGNLFGETYGSKDMIVLDIGGQNVNGSLRSFFENKGMKYICLDICKHESVDIVIKPGEKLPFKDGYVDLIVSTSCFEHDPCFWITFKEMCRITKVDGYIYVNAPSNGQYHCYPGDNWRFYSDAGQALAYWSTNQIANETIFPVIVEETFHIYPKADQWIDFVCVWKRVLESTDSNIVVSEEIRNRKGPLKTALLKNNFNVQNNLLT